MKSVLPKGKIAFRQCLGCNTEQADLGSNVECENCGECDWTNPYYFYDEYQTEEIMALTEDYTEES